MQDLYKRLLDFTRDGVYRYDFDDGRILFANQGLVDILGLDCTPEQLVGRHLKDVLVYTEREGTIRTALREHGQIHGFEYHFETLKGEMKCVLHDSFIAVDAVTKQKVVEAIVKDITDRRRAEAELERYRDDLEKLVEERTAQLAGTNAKLVKEIADRTRAEEELRATAQALSRSNAELEQFAFAASHDLQEPLRKIVAFGDRLKTACGAVLTEQGLDYLSRMQNAAERMHLLIDGLLAYSRVSSRARPFSQVDLNQTVKDVLGDIEERIKETRGRVEISDLPVLDADATQMRQLMQNLIGNALKFHKPGVAPYVKVYTQEAERDTSTGEDKGQIRILVEDNGIGFDDKDIDRIFILFQRLHTRADYEGSGIGLAICRKIVERHGGTITAQSRSGEGSKFIVTLPLKQAEARPDAVGGA